MPDTDSRGRDHKRFEAEKKNGVYLLGIESQRLGYTVKSGSDITVVENVTVHGHYIGTSDYFETECTDFEITEDGTLDLRYCDPEDGDD